ncbi:rab-like protein 2A isoform X3 [Meleagris gallopavo]|uniref:rab-like protein 2A isoform X3 n=1 Tax=Meleagris gallopavo TaxID=9103 RepID=UPI00093F5527|nr:rab-like protein 2A isoform X3 [Meleagris gallopavo]
MTPSECDGARVMTSSECDGAVCVVSERGRSGGAMAEAGKKPRDEAQVEAGPEEAVNIICLGDSAVGKSKLLERFLLDGLYPRFRPRPSGVGGAGGKRAAGGRRRRGLFIRRLLNVGAAALSSSPRSPRTLYRHRARVDGKAVLMNNWDTAGQERFQSVHASYYHKAHACIMHRNTGQRQHGQQRG